MDPDNAGGEEGSLTDLASLLFGDIFGAKDIAVWEHLYE